MAPPRKLDRKKIAELYKNGMNGIEIAKEIGSNKKTIYAILAQEGIDTRSRNAEKKEQEERFKREWNYWREQARKYLVQQGKKRGARREKM